MASEQGRRVEEASEALRAKEKEPTIEQASKVDKERMPTPELASKVAVPAEETREKPHVAPAVPAETRREKHDPATTETKGKHAALPTSTQPEEHKPGFMGHMKEKMVEVKDKLTGHGQEHPSSPKHQEEPAPAAAAHETTTTTPKSPKSPSFFQSLKEKLTGGHPHEQKAPITTPQWVPPSGHATETAPLSSSETTTPAKDPHHEGISEKMSHLFKGHGSETTGKHGSQEAQAVTKSDDLKQ